MRQKASFFFILFALFTSNAWAAGTAPASLVEIFCETVLSSPTELPLWERLETRLEKREAPSPTEVRAPGWAHCLAANADDFDEAEFISKGRALVLLSIQKTQSPSAPSPEETTEIDRPAPRVDEAVSRAARYDQLWHAFLERLRSRVAAVYGSAQLVENAD